MRRFRYLCEIGDALALVILEFGIHLLPVVGHGEDCVCSMESVLDRLLVVNVAGDTFHASGFQRFGIRLGRVTCDTTDFEFIGSLGIVQDGIDDRTTLVASCAEDNEDLFLRHFVIGDASILFK